VSWSPTTSPAVRGTPAAGSISSQRVAVALEQAHLAPADAQDMITVARLHDAHERLGVETLGHDGQFPHRALQAIDLEQAGRAKDGQPVLRVVPEFGVFGKVVKRRQQRRDFPFGIFLLQGCLKLPDQVPEPDPVLLPVGIGAVGRLVKRQAGRFTFGKQCRIIACKRIHDGLLMFRLVAGGLSCRSVERAGRLVPRFPDPVADFAFRSPAAAPACG